MNHKAKPDCITYLNIVVIWISLHIHRYYTMRMKYRAHHVRRHIVAISTIDQQIWSRLRLISNRRKDVHDRHGPSYISPHRSITSNQFLDIISSMDSHSAIRNITTNTEIRNRRVLNQAISQCIMGNFVNQISPSLTMKRIMNINHGKDRKSPIHQNIPD